jgi:hypothetical protein
MTSNAWKSVIDADLKDAEYTPQAPIPKGVYNAIVSNVEAKTFESGSKGVQVGFTLTGGGDTAGRQINDYYVILLADGEVNRTGPAALKKLMLACGLTTEQILGFRYPEFAEKGQKSSFGDFKKLLDEPLMITIDQQLQKKGKNAGKTFARVTNVQKGV